MNLIENILTITFLMYLISGTVLGVKDIYQTQIVTKKTNLFGKVVEFTGLLLLLIISGMALVYPIEYVVRNRK